MSSRASIRAAFGALITSQLVGDGKLLQAAYDYAPLDFGGASPVVAMASAGSARPKASSGGASARHRIDLFIFVLRAEAEKGAYTPADADAALDTIEAALADLVAVADDNPAWSSVAYAAESTIEPQEIGGASYWMERVPLLFTIL